MPETVSPLEILWTGLGFAALVINAILLYSALVDAWVVEGSERGEPYITLAARWVWVDLWLVFWQICFVVAGLVSAVKPEPIRESVKEGDLLIAVLFILVQATMVIAAVMNFQRRRYLNRYDFRIVSKAEQLREDTLAMETRVTQARDDIETSG